MSRGSSTDEVPVQGLSAAEFRALYPRLRRFAGAVRSAGVEADDLVQEALVGLFRRQSNEPVGDLEAYLRRSILNAELSRRRSGLRQDRLRPTLAQPDVAVQPYPSDLDELRRLAPIDRALLYVTAVEGWTFAEAAGLLERPEASLRVRAARARQQLRGELRRADRE